MNERNVKDMRDTKLVNALREHAEWAEGNQWETPITLGDDLAEAADRMENQNAHIAALQQEIEKLRGQNEQLREAAALVAKKSAELLERRWIPVTERLPEYDARVLAFDMRAKNKYIGIWTREKDPDDGNDCWFDLAGWWYAFDEITHWMPLPEPPKEER